ncbi:hypothetical protein GPA10_38680 [Streptomyces sp. p1417]|uniref:Novel STAND NTPase 1 domain-containing protein n=1 Tax=Streptomyces typhae TaxID=2681492 RepID=A0A6L6X9H5_9ACTN|nr:hypothetical protein [Streptomyces typhae]MVO90522.1 hypothetical protein [Streptomyces typhae]
MGRREKPLDPAAGPVARFALALRVLRARAGSPTYREMAQQAAYSATAFSRAASGEQLPSLEVTLAFATTCGGDQEEWERRWHQVRSEVARLPAEPVDPSVAPYRGLARFEPGDQERFFGRGRLTDELVELACAQRITMVLGPSGSGKSSLLRAGLVPRLRQLDDEAARPAAIRILTPGAHPFADHHGRCDPAAGEGDTWLVVDQFEEVFTLCQDAAQRAQFIRLLLRAQAADSRLRVVLGVRADFYARCLEHEDLASVLAKASLPVGPMTRDELREAIVKPAAGAGLLVERALTARLIEDAAGQAGSLPLVSHALLETCRRRRGRSLTMEAYEAAGGLHGAIAQSAETLYAQLTEAQAELARLLLLRLITPGAGAPDTRRPADRIELDLSEDSGDVHEVLDRLARARLITLDEHTVDLAHEALISAWPRLLTWIDQSRERLRCHRRLTEAAHRWQEIGHDSGALYRGALLATAEEHFPLAHGRRELTKVERAFLTASTAARDEEQLTAARTARRLRRFTAALSVLLVLALTTGLLAWKQSLSSGRERDRALDAQRVAQSRQLAAQSAALLDEDPDLASLLAVQAHRTAPTPEAAGSLYSAYGLPLRHRLVGHTGGLRALAFSRDGRTLVSTAEDRDAYLWDTATGTRRTVVSNYGDETYRMTLTPDARTLAVAGLNDGTLRLSQVATGRVRHVLHTQSGFDELAFSPDGRTLATRIDDEGVRLWDVAHGKPRITLTGRTKDVSELVFSPDGKTLAAATENGVGLWDVGTGKLRTMLTGRYETADAMAFSPDGRTLATNGTDGKMWLWDTATGKARSSLPGGAEVLTFSPDGRTLAAGGFGAVQLWDAPTGKLRATLAGHTDRTNVMRFSPDGRTLATGGDDKTVRLWDVAAGTTPATRTHRTGYTFTVALSPDRRTLATADRRGTVHLRNTNRNTLRLSLTGHTDAVTAIAFSPDGRTLATGGGDHTVRLWDVKTGDSLRVLPAENLTAAAFSPDGETLAVAGYEKAWLWNTATGRIRTTVSESAEALAFSPDGKTLATADRDYEVRLRSAATGKTRTTLRGHTSSLESMVFSPDGATLATSSMDNTVRVWNVTTGKASKAVARHSDVGSALAFGPGEQLLAVTSGADTSVRLWDVETGRTRTTFTGHTGHVISLTFSPDASALITSSEDNTVRVWKPDLPTTATSIRKICRLIHRDLTPLERSVYLPNQPAHPVCSL